MQDEIERLEKVFKDGTQVEKRKLVVFKKQACLFFIECLTDSKLISSEVIKPLAGVCEKTGPTNVLEELATNVITLAGAKVASFNKAQEDILSGYAVLAIDGEGFISLPVVGYEKRAIAEPPTSSVLKGPREGFVEDINVNISMIRRRLKTTDLRLKTLKIGRKSQTRVELVYLCSIVDKNVLKALISRLKKIDIDGITASFYIESLLRNNDSLLFRQIGSTEKPDIAMAKLMEGRIVILVDGSPISLSVPYVFLEDFQNSDDYYMHPARASFVRMIRLLGIIVGVLLPGFYVAMESYHYRVLPISLLINILSSIENISFPPMVEILLSLFLFEILNEASIRMPKYLGMALSIVGALVLGDTAVKAGIITQPSILVMAVSSITIYILPDQAPTTSILRLLFTLAGGFAGFFGIIVGLNLLTAMLVSTNNFNAPLMAPFAPYIKMDQKDAIIKSGVVQMITRPKSIRNKNRIRQTPRTRQQKEAIIKQEPTLKKQLEGAKNDK